MPQSFDELLQLLQERISELSHDQEALRQLEREHGTLREAIEILERLLRQQLEEIRALRKS